ncbi:MAG TPA: polyphenol oxidase family protein [Gaiellaceae bacterium]|nr:polyphenol oxidase family protein [Gaiellaceae bacterium]
MGGVSEGPYASLNLGAATQDDPERVFENRRRAVHALDGDPATAALAFQVHGAEVVKPEPVGIDRVHERPHCDGLWTDEPDRALMLLTADCLPIALARHGAVSVLHAGWRGLLAGIAQAGIDALGGEVHAVIGPGIGPCCYEVGGEVAAPFRERFGDDVVRGRNLDLWSAAERALAGAASVERTDLCTSCNPELFFSHRRDRGVTGRQGVVARVAG